MITIKLNPYSDEEKDVLKDLIDEIDFLFNDNFCDENTPCSACKYRNVCYDIDKIVSYMHKKTRKTTD